MRKLHFKLLTLGLFLSSYLGAEGEAAQPAAREGNFMQTLIMIGIAVLFFYFILWRPEQKRRKAMEQQRSALKKGDRVTAMGIIGTVAQIKDNSVILRMVDGAKIEVLKNAITDVQPGSEDDLKKVEKEEAKVSS
ncbi:MAG TPA: preprotein translocase subunit YajC [Rhabdochlamydiaceae bacterium]|nr:preprotein translocase subunit YajC [Rhabdochlamydiaceae bacterium]